MEYSNVPARTLANAISEFLFAPPLVPSYCTFDQVSISVGISDLQMDLVESFSELNENWDGNNGLPISGNTIARAKQLLASWKPESHALDPVINPHPNGLITFEWESMFGEAYIELGQSSYCAYLAPTVGAPKYWDSVGGVGEFVGILSTVLKSLFPHSESSQLTITAPFQHASSR